jgi:magnesium chelatase family protein
VIDDESDEGSDDPSLQTDGKKATHRCNCGMHGSKLKQCKCSPMQIEKYLTKISGPLLDRIAIHVHVQPVDVEMLSSSSRRMTSVEMRNMVQRAREMQAKRFAAMNGIDCNARLPEAMFSQYCKMESAAEALFISAQKASLVSARARAHIIRLARTIADLGGSETLDDRHVGEALQYRGRG